jgi:DNA-binding response OmpR family regulator
MANATILLVDDDEVLRHTLAAVLQEHGFGVNNRSQRAGGAETNQCGKLRRTTQ